MRTVKCGGGASVLSCASYGTRNAGLEEEWLLPVGGPLRTFLFGCYSDPDFAPTYTSPGE